MHTPKASDGLSNREEYRVTADIVDAPAKTRVRGVVSKHSPTKGGKKTKCVCIGVSSRYQVAFGGETERKE